MKDELERLKRQYLDRLKNQKRLGPLTLQQYEREIHQLIQSLTKAPSPLEICLTPVSPVPVTLAPALESGILQNYLSTLSPATHVRKLIIWKAFLKECPTPWNTLLKDFDLPKLRQKLPLFLTEEEIFRLEQACYKISNCTRNRLFLAFALQLGLRLSEILNLRFSNIEKEWLSIIRKGGKEQRLPLSPSLQTLIHFWKGERKAHPENWIFLGQSGTPLTQRAAQKILKMIAQKADIQKKISPHSLRHTFATQLASRGASLPALKEILGHQRLTTTERYLHVTPEHLKETFQLLSGGA